MSIEEENKAIHRRVYEEIWGGGTKQETGVLNG